MNGQRLRRIFAASVAFGLFWALGAKVETGWVRAAARALAGCACGFVIVCVKDMVRGGAGGEGEAGVGGPSSSTASGGGASAEGEPAVQSSSTAPGPGASGGDGDEAGSEAVSGGSEDGANGEGGSA